MLPSLGGYCDYAGKGVSKVRPHITCVLCPMSPWGMLSSTHIHCVSVWPGQGSVLHPLDFKAWIRQTSLPQAWGKASSASLAAFLVRVGSGSPGNPGSPSLGRASCWLWGASGEPILPLTGHFQGRGPRRECGPPSTPEALSRTHHPGDRAWRGRRAVCGGGRQAAPLRPPPLVQPPSTDKQGSSRCHSKGGLLAQRGSSPGTGLEAGGRAFSGSCEDVWGHLEKPLRGVTIPPLAGQPPPGTPSASRRSGGALQLHSCQSQLWRLGKGSVSLKVPGSTGQQGPALCPEFLCTARFISDKESGLLRPCQPLPGLPGPQDQVQSPPRTGEASTSLLGVGGSAGAQGSGEEQAEASGSELVMAML